MSETRTPHRAAEKAFEKTIEKATGAVVEVTKPFGADLSFFGRIADVRACVAFLTGTGKFGLKDEIEIFEDDPEFACAFVNLIEGEV